MAHCTTVLLDTADCIDIWISVMTDDHGMNKNMRMHLESHLKISWKEKIISSQTSSPCSEKIGANVQKQNLAKSDLVFFFQNI